MKKTGELLKSAREQKGVTINEVALVTKINAKTIELMERGDINLLPRKAFLRGFVQTYSRYLELDQKMILDLFQEEMGSIRPSLPQAGQLPERMGDSSPLKGIDQADPGSRTRMILLVSLGVALVVAIFIVLEVVKKYENESKLPTSTTLTTNTIPTPVDTSNLSEVPLPPSELIADDTSTTTTSSTTSTTKLAAAIATTTSTSTTTTSTKPTTTTRTTTTTLRSTTSTTSRTTTTSRSTTTTTSRTTTTSTSRTTTTTLVKAKMVEVIFEALDNVTVEYKIDGGSNQSFKLAPDQIKVIKASSQLELNISDGGAVNIIKNGVDQGVPGTLGKPAKIKIP